MVVPTYRGDSGIFTIEFGPGGDPRFPRPCVSTYPGLCPCKPDFFCSSPGALGFPPVLCTANPLKREESYMPSPTPTSWPEWTPSQRLQLTSPRLLFNLVRRNFAPLANNRYSMPLQLRDRRDKSASLESSPNAPELFRASWVRGGIAKILPNRTMNAVLVQGLLLLWDGF